MSSFMLQILACLLCSFLLGLAMGRLVWRFGEDEKTEKSELDFWRSKLEQSRVELWDEQERMAQLKEDHIDLKKRFAALGANAKSW